MRTLSELKNEGPLRFRAQADRRQAEELPTGGVERRGRWAEAGFCLDRAGAIQDRQTAAASEIVRNDRSH